MTSVITLRKLAHGDGPLTGWLAALLDDEGDWTITQRQAAPAADTEAITAHHTSSLVYSQAERTSQAKRLYAYLLSGHQQQQPSRRES